MKLRTLLLLLLALSLAACEGEEACTPAPDPDAAQEAAEAPLRPATAAWLPEAPASHRAPTVRPRQLVPRRFLGVCVHEAVRPCACDVDGRVDQGEQLCVNGQWLDCDCGWCLPGELRLCECPGADAGIQECEEVDRWGRCECGEAAR